MKQHWPPQHTDEVHWPLSVQAPQTAFWQVWLRLQSVLVQHAPATHAPAQQTLLLPQDAPSVQTTHRCCALQ
jgi:hypothetical protein